MDLNKLNSKVKIINDELPIEIFCKKKFKGYYIRGQIIEKKQWIHRPANQKDLRYFFCRILILVLVNKEYQRKWIDPIVDRNKKDNFHKSKKTYFTPEAYPDIHINFTENGFYFGIFFGNTEEEFLKKMNRIDLNYLNIDDEEPDFEFQRDFELNPVNTKNNPPVYIDYENINLNENDPYIVNSIQKKKNIILLDLDIFVDRVISKKDTYCIPEIITQLSSSFYISQGLPKTPTELLPSLSYLLFNTIYYNCSFQLMNKVDFEQIITKIRYLCFTWLKFNNINSEFLSILNYIKKDRNNNSNILKNFCYKFYDNLTDALIKKNKVKQCQHCGDFFQYRKYKKYCSLKFEGKDCGKKARNKRSYERRKNINQKLENLGKN